MKDILRFFWVSIFIFTFAYAQGNEVSILDLFSSQKAQKDTDLRFEPDVKNESGFVPDDQEEDTFESSPFDKKSEDKELKPITKSLFAFYQDLPKKAYVGELIHLKIKLVIAREFDNLKISNISNEDGLLIDYMDKLFKDEQKKNVYIKNIFFKANKTMDKLPPLYVELMNKNEIVESINLPQESINIIKLHDDEGRFINVFAKNLHVSKFKTNTFDEDKLITVLEINAQYSNLEDIHLQNVLRQGIDTKSGNYEDKTIFYFAIIPKQMQNMQLSYFNTNFNKFEIINIPIILEEEDLSTQVNINPKKNRFELYKDIAIIVITLLFLVLFVAKKRYVFALIALLFCMYLLYLKFSFGNVMIKKNTKVRILPTANSTIFYTTNGTETVEKLNTVNSYIKILLPNQKIGWIKDEDLIKN